MNKFICSIEFCTSYFNLSNKRRVLQGVWRALLKWIEKLSITGLPEQRSAKTRGLMIHPNNYSLWTQQLIQFNSNFWPPKEKLTKQISVHSIKYLHVPDLSVYTLCAKIEILAAKSGPDKVRLSFWGPCLPKKGTAWLGQTHNPVHAGPAHLPTLDRVPCSLQIYVMQPICHVEAQAIIGFNVIYKIMPTLKKKKMKILFLSTTFYLVTRFHLVVWCEKFSLINSPLTW